MKRRATHELHPGNGREGHRKEQDHYHAGDPERQDIRRKNTHGQWNIEPAELHRVYPEVTKGNGSHAEYETTRNTELQYKINLLERDLQAAAEKSRQQEESIGDLKDQRERLRQDVQDWKEQVQRKRLTWRGLFGGGKAE